MTEVGRYLSNDSNDSMVESVSFSGTDEPGCNGIQMFVTRANGRCDRSVDYTDIASMLGRLQAVAQGWHKVPLEALENMGKVAEITERDAKLKIT